MITKRKRPPTRGNHPTERPAPDLRRARSKARGPASPRPVR
jgi:hypothetical protein